MIEGVPLISSFLLFSAARIIIIIIIIIIIKYLIYIAPNIKTSI